MRKMALPSYLSFKNMDDSSLLKSNANANTWHAQKEFPPKSEHCLNASVLMLTWRWRQESEEGLPWRGPPETKGWPRVGILQVSEPRHSETAPQTRSNCWTEDSWCCGWSEYNWTQTQSGTLSAETSDESCLTEPLELRCWFRVGRAIFHHKLIYLWSKGILRSSV